MNNLGKVFISHSSIDKPFVDKIVKDLTQRKIPVWYDKFDIKLGESIPDKINKGIRDSKYFIIVLSKNSVSSKWVNEELNAALMKQINSKGTFVLPIVIEEIEIPPLLAHRSVADFREDYDKGLTTILSALSLDYKVSKSIPEKKLFPWPDSDSSDKQYLYLHSNRFDKFFKMNCDFDWSVDRTIDYIVATLALPWNQEIVELGMKWSFSYGIELNGKSLILNKKINNYDPQNGEIIRLNISGTYQDLYENELKEMWDGKKFYEIFGAMKHERELKDKINERGQLSRSRIREIANSCFKHV
ncbi:toll/interleukin-1 receptor domain-containing protein [Fulvivirgaceae bacterium BMA10]|uniref:Toll/interleukin-1 receptor domain-containing protein n=1 Tax=Splendidivirga corallicola TaxID=3051826 RepID=A0ABT8KU12_9BACT|nr:toll/interleukin-1 receptor domain-containing protein [Fulvivirgaceae bacterium BMA10]